MADPAIALQIKTPSIQESLTPISTMLNIKSQQQQLQKGAVDVQQSQMDLQERNALRELAKNLGQYKTEGGGLDLPKLVNDATQAAPKLGMQFAQQIASAHTEGIGVNRALNTLSEERRGAIGKVVMSVADQPYQVQEKVINSVVEGNPGLKVWGDMALDHLKRVAGSPTAKDVAFSIAKATTGVHDQNVLNTPSGPVVSSGQTTQMINVNPMAGKTGPVAGTAVQAEIPPTAGTVDAQGNPLYVGAKPPRGPLPSGPKLGVPGAIAGTVDSMNKDWETTQQEAARAPQDIGVLQNIKKFAKGAITGVASERRSFIAGLAGLVGMSPAELEKTNTDLLAKNSNMLALAGGDTNLARTMAEAANPNTHMTKEAIEDAANQVIAQRKMSAAKQRYLRPFKTLNDPDAYNKALVQWNQHADPRVLQLQSMSKDEKAKMKAAMNPQEQKEFGNKIRKLNELGVLGE